MITLRPFLLLMLSLYFFHFIPWHLLHLLFDILLFTLVTGSYVYFLLNLLVFLNNLWIKLELCFSSYVYYLLSVSLHLTEYDKFLQVGQHLEVIMNNCLPVSS